MFREVVLGAIMSPMFNWDTSTSSSGMLVCFCLSLCALISVLVPKLGVPLEGWDGGFTLI